MMLLAYHSNDLILFLPDAMRVFLAVWLFAVGGCIGSFLNVVVLRMPAGISIARSGSRCPICLHPIRWFDNIPIFSWLALRGRCRDCGTPISIRYPLVELLVACIFLVLGLASGLGSGANLPLPIDAPHYFRFPAIEAWSVYAFHIVAIVTITGAALIERDRHEVPRRLFLPAILIGFLAPIGFPLLHPVGAFANMPNLHWTRGLADASCGLLAGILLGAATWPATSRQPWRPGGDRTAILACVTVGLCVGWQASSAVIAIASLTFLFGSTIGGLNTRVTRGSWCSYLAPSLLAYIILWRLLVGWLPLLGAEGPWFPWVTSALFVLLASLATAWLTPAREFIPQTNEERATMAPANREENLKAILNSRSYLPVEYDAEFLQQPETRPVRVQLELMKTEIGLLQEGVESTVVVFGGTQVVEAQDAKVRLHAAKEALAASPDDPLRKRAVERLVRIAAKSHFYDAAREFGKLVSSNCQIAGKCDYVIVTGGGPGIMEAANRGAHDVGAKSIGLNITLPAEQMPNSYITPELCFQFHYFALRKMHFLMRAKAMVVFPGGFGTLDELFDALTLRQTERMQEIPVILFGREYWQQVVDFQFLADEGVIADKDLELLDFVDTPAEAWEIITRFHNHRGRRDGS